MNNYTQYQRGSEWRRWDLHIHTPETKKNDQFEGSNVTEKWEKFIDTINASVDEVAVVGITDYFCIDNYFKFNNFIATGKITKKFDLILPNIEIRVLPVTGSATPINLHCIFNPAIDADIETRFLSKLKFSYSGSDYSATKQELIRLGKALPGNTGLDETAAWKAGLNQYVVNMENLRSIFEKDPKLRENTIIVVSNKSTDGNSGTTKHEDFFISTNQSQLDATRWSIYQFSDALFSSNEKDILYFTAFGPDNREVVIEKCGALMPCFHGCDAHDNNKIFKPDGNRYCWIKADPTFEGLKQTLYEPANRVKIQGFRPDIKNERQVISEVQFLDSGTLFGNQKIQLNENLNAIIGGKSSGKSLLLYSIAKSIDPEQVNRTAKRLGFDGYSFDSNFDFEVTWKNGEKDTLNTSDEKRNKVTYIPQLYINHLVEKNNKEELNSLIENILLQDAPFKEFYEETKRLISETNSEIESLLSSYLQVRVKGLDFQQKSKDLGKSETINKGIENIQKAINDGQKLTTLSEEEFKDYNKLITDKTTAEKNLGNLKNKEVVLNKILIEVRKVKLDLVGKNDPSGMTLKGSIDRILDEMTDIPEEMIVIKSKIETDYDSLIRNLEQQIGTLKIEDIKKTLNDSLVLTNENLKPYLSKIAGQQELQKLTKSLEAETSKLLQALNLEKQLSTTLTDYADIRKQTVLLLKKRIDYYEDIIKRINDTKKDIGSEITLYCQLLFKQDEFMLFDQANKASISKEHYFNELFVNGLVKYDLIPGLYENNLRVSDEKLLVKEETNIPLKQRVSLEDVLRGLVKDGFELDYTVTYKNDDLLKMSPGKKGTVLLILFLQISSAQFPILIDQPEDNLDNRTIYDLLCQMIKEKKKERQIIIVSHNANLVVATDTENIIVANQEGQDSVGTTSQYRFEYVNGSVEHTFPKDTSISEVLYQQGIREHICDILEGGNEAFKQRERKYSIK